MAACQLPIDIYRRIINQLNPPNDNSTLAALARTCRLIHGVAEKRLYSILMLYGPLKLQQALQAVTARPLLGIYPREIVLRAIERERTQESYWQLVSDFLHRAAASAERIILVAPEAESVRASWVLRSLHNANGTLHSLYSSFAWDAEYVSFLESAGARGLVRLDTSDIPGVPSMGSNRQQQSSLFIPNATLSLRRDAAPYLTQIDAPISAVCLLVPGRPISQIRLRFGTGSSLQSLPSPYYFVAQVLARSTAPKGVLLLDVGDLTAGYRAETYSLEVLELAPLYMPHIRSIGNINYPWYKDGDVTRIYKALLRLHELHTMDVIVTHLHPTIDRTWTLITALEFRMYGAALAYVTFWKGFDRYRCIWSEEEQDFIAITGSD